MKTDPSKDTYIDHVKEKHDEEIYKRHKEGQTYRALGKTLGISATAAFNAFCRHEYKLAKIRSSSNKVNNVL